MNVLSTNYYISYHWDGGGINLSWLTEEGYITFDERGEPLYHYYLRDHLGGVRVVFDQTGTVEQVNDYYPSGTLMYTSTNGTVQPYKNTSGYLQEELVKLYKVNQREFNKYIVKAQKLLDRYNAKSTFKYINGGNDIAF